MAKAELFESFTHEINDITYEGRRKITGTKTLDQVVEYKGKCKQDMHGYPSELKDTIMLSMAKQILFELVSGRTLSTQSSAKHGFQAK